MCAPIVLAIPVLVPLMMSPTRDCQLGRLGDLDADERAVIAFNLAVDEYVAVRRLHALPWPPPEKGTFFTPAVADVFRVRVAEMVRQSDASEGWDFSTLPPLPPELLYRFVKRDLVLFDVELDAAVDALALVLPAVLEELDMKWPVPPAAEELAGCLYGL